MISPNPWCFTAVRIRLMCRAVTPRISAASIHVISPLIAFIITCCLVIALTSRAIHRSILMDQRRNAQGGHL
jgi:hypothetical protein